MFGWGIGVAERCSVQMLREQHSTAHGAHAVFCITCGVFRWKWKWKIEMEWGCVQHARNGLGEGERGKEKGCLHVPGARLRTCVSVQRESALFHGSWVRPHFLPCEMC